MRNNMKKAFLLAGVLALGLVSFTAQSADYTLRSVLFEVRTWGIKNLDVSEYKWRKSRDKLLTRIVGSTVNFSGLIDPVGIVVNEGIASYRIKLEWDDDPITNKLSNWNIGDLFQKFDEIWRSTQSYTVCGGMDDVIVKIKDTSDRLALDFVGMTHISGTGRISRVEIVCPYEVQIDIEMTTWSAT